MLNQIDNDSTEHVQNLAQQTLARLWGDDTHCHWSSVEGHNVWRVQRVETGESVIVKTEANVANARALAPSGRAPQVLAADAESGLCVTEDLGDTTLSDILANTDRDAASAGLVDLASALGNLHGWGWSHLSASPNGRHSSLTSLPLAAFFNLCGALEVDAEPAQRELFEAERCMVSDDPQVVLHGDVCPSNYVPAASTQDVGKFIDFEECCRGNAILEVACWHMPFPTCWHVARLPARLRSRMDASYLAAFALRRREMFDESMFQRLLAAACVYWVVWCLTGKRIIESNDDRFAGELFASVRQRGLLWLDNASATIAASGEFKVTGNVVRDVTARLRQRWEPVGDVPTYQAFLT